MEKVCGMQIQLFLLSSFPSDPSISLDASQDHLETHLHCRREKKQSILKYIVLIQCQSKKIINIVYSMKIFFFKSKLWVHTQKIPLELQKKAAKNNKV